MSDLRLRLNEALDEITDESLKELLGNLSLGVKKWGYCDKCHKKVNVDYPDYNGFAKALATLLDQAKGKPVEKVVVDIAARRLEDIRNASDEELAAILDGEVVEFPAKPALPPVA